MRKTYGYKIKQDLVEIDWLEFVFPEEIKWRKIETVDGAWLWRKIEAMAVMGIDRGNGGNGDRLRPSWFKVK